MSVQRYISSDFWSDDWVDALSVKEKLLYMYLLTNERTNVAGVYKTTVKRIKDDTGISRKRVLAGLKKFAKAKKAFFAHGYMVIPKWPKHQKLGERGTLRLAVRKLLKALPGIIIDFLREPGNYDYDLSFLGGGGGGNGAAGPAAEPGCPEPEEPDYPEPEEPDYPEPKEPDYPEPKEPDYPEPKEPDYPGAAAGNGPGSRPAAPDGGRACQGRGAGRCQDGAAIGHGYPMDTPPDDLDLDLDLDIKACVFKPILNTHTSVFSPEENAAIQSGPAKTFLRIWQTTPGELFNRFAGLERPKDYARYWAQSALTSEEVERRMNNLIADAQSGAMQRRYIPKTPDRFILGGGLERHRTRLRTVNPARRERAVYEQDYSLSVLKKIPGLFSGEPAETGGMEA
jgi:hypothetical protein